MNPFIWNNIQSHEILEEANIANKICTFEIVQQIFYKCGILLLLLFDLSRSTLFIETLICDRQGGVYFFCFTDIYHQTTIIKFQCQMRRGEYVNYITNRGVHTGQSNSVARSHILNLSMNESLFTDRYTETTYV